MKQLLLGTWVVLGTLQQVECVALFCMCCLIYNCLNFHLFPPTLHFRHLQTILKCDVLSCSNAHFAAGDDNRVQVTYIIVRSAKCILDTKYHHIIINCTAFINLWQYCIDDIVAGAKTAKWMMTVQRLNLAALGVNLLCNVFALIDWLIC